MPQAAAGSGMESGMDAAHNLRLLFDGHPQRQAQGSTTCRPSARRSRCTVYKYQKKEGRLSLKSSLPAIAACGGFLRGAAAGWLEEEWLKKAFGLFFYQSCIIQYIGRSPKGRV